jgi:two-component system LytT family sensor kinase
MKATNIESFLDQRNPLSHIIFTVITLAGVSLIVLINRGDISFNKAINFFILGLIQLEIFIFAARMIFRKFETTIPGREFTKMILTRFMLFIILCFIAALIIILTFNYILVLINGGDGSLVIKNFFSHEFNTWFKATLGGLSIGAVIFIVIQWQDALKREQKLREENLVFQNETLRNQVNPHFLFNSLNTLSALISTNPEAADRFVNKLSSIYRYILENSQKYKVSLKSELDYITDYLELHKIRGEEKISLSIKAPDPDKYEILPVSIQILIENAIKHNKATRENPLAIEIFIEDSNIVVRNNLQKMATKLGSTGIGLKNLAERIKLVTGKSLEVEETDDSFIVKVPLL